MFIGMQDSKERGGLATGMGCGGEVWEEFSAFQV
jgi:hypothetical protein